MEPQESLRASWGLIGLYFIGVMRRFRYATVP
jgi:hypothetical protein